jgi:ribosome-binding factor A
MRERQERFARLVHEELSMLIDGVEDPRVAEAGILTITHVKVSADLGSARVYLRLGDATPGTEARVLAGLKKATGWLRHELARSIQAKKVPELHFYFDEAGAGADRVEQILKELAAEKRGGEPEGGGEPESGGEPEGGPGDEP